ncbi:unnamed protein product [Pedinophyceae sp. YPF-701]|nr:unnamed protein product [Pedinophyceae sp. YPF-701]
MSATCAMAAPSAACSELRAPRRATCAASRPAGPRNGRFAHSPTTRRASSRHRMSDVRASSESVVASGPTTFLYKQVELETKFGIALFDITPQIREAVKEAAVAHGTVHVVSRHTTTAVTINEMEDRLIDDVRQWCLKMAPPTHPYLHNDIHLRDGPPDWPGGNEAWRAQEPINAHSHLLSMMLGNTASIPVVGGDLVIGTWQSVILVELDGPRTRTVGVQVVGVEGA